MTHIADSLLNLPPNPLPPSPPPTVCSLLIMVRTLAVFPIPSITFITSTFISSWTSICARGVFMTVIFYSTTNSPAYQK